jgi:hypothetical protein
LIIRKAIRYLNNRIIMALPIAERHNRRHAFRERERDREKRSARVRMRHVQTQYRIAPEATWHLYIFATCLFFLSMVRRLKGRGKGTEKASCAVIGYLQDIG